MDKRKKAYDRLNDQLAKLEMQQTDKVCTCSYFQRVNEMQVNVVVVVDRPRCNLLSIKYQLLSVKSVIHLSINSTYVN